MINTKAKDFLTASGDSTSAQVMQCVARGIVIVWCAAKPTARLSLALAAGFARRPAACARPVPATPRCVVDREHHRIRPRGAVPARTRFKRRTGAQRQRLGRAPLSLADKHASHSQTGCVARGVRRASDGRRFSLAAIAARQRAQFGKTRARRCSFVGESCARPRVLAAPTRNVRNPGYAAAAPGAGSGGERAFTAAIKVSEARMMRRCTTTGGCVGCTKRLSALRLVTHARGLLVADPSESWLEVASVGDWAMVGRRRWPARPGTVACSASW